MIQAPVDRQYEGRTELGTTKIQYKLFSPTFLEQGYN